MDKRRSGLLLHISSLPSRYGIGDLGHEAYRFADQLAGAKQRYWQILPLNPTDTGTDNSPFLSQAAFGFNPLLISPDLLIKEGFLETADLEPLPGDTGNHVDYPAVTAYKNRLFTRAFGVFKTRGANPAFEAFCREQQGWLEDYSLFVALKARFKGKTWSLWPSEFRDRDPEALRKAQEELREDMEKAKFLQFLFMRQWAALKSYCNERDIRIVGDIPIYVAYDSVDVWVYPGLFKLDEKKQPVFMAGCPPDYFSETGQLWGNPVYNWDAIQADRFSWWNGRIGHNLNLFDIMRIDHFRGFVGFWEVPAGEKTAVNGHWSKAPADAFFGQLKTRFPEMPIIAEDLGVITPDVAEIMVKYNLPGMKILMFAFAGDWTRNPYIPHNVIRHCFYYTGTHDNNTIQDWMKNEIGEEERRRVYRYIGRQVQPEELHWEMMRLCMRSVADTVVFPVQDLLGLCGTHRMNNPAVYSGNWRWKLQPGQLDAAAFGRLSEMTETYGRNNPHSA